jgi:hypothetical protein
VETKNQSVKVPLSNNRTAELTVSHVKDHPVRYYEPYTDEDGRTNRRQVSRQVPATKVFFVEGTIVIEATGILAFGDQFSRANGRRVAAGKLLEYLRRGFRTVYTPEDRYRIFRAVNPKLDAAPAKRRRDAVVLGVASS